MQPKHYFPPSIESNRARSVCLHDLDAESILKLPNFQELRSYLLAAAAASSAASVAGSLYPGCDSVIVDLKINFSR